MVELVNNLESLFSALVGGGFTAGVAWGVMRSHIRQLIEHDDALFRRLEALEQALMQKGLQ